MNNLNHKAQGNPVLKAVKTFFSKLVKAHDEYPIKYYKRDKNYTRSREA